MDKDHKLQKLSSICIYIGFGCRSKILYASNIKGIFAWNWNLSGINIKYQDIHFKEHSKKLLLLMNSFWVEIGGRGISINWLVKVRGHLNKVENEQTKSK